MAHSCDLSLALAVSAQENPNTTTAPEDASDAFTIGKITVDKRAKTVRFPATVNLAEGPVEYLLVTDKGKTHENLFATTVSPYQLHIAMLLLGGSSTVNYTAYDSVGRVLALNENGSGGITRSYDHLGRVKSYTGPNGTIGYRYYASGRLYKLIYPGGNDTTGHVEYAYTSAGQLYQVIDRLGGSVRTTTYAWRPDGSLSSITRPNGTMRTISPDDVGRPIAITETQGSAAFLEYTLGYYPNDAIQSLKATPQPTAAQLSTLPTPSMGFNSANQLISFNGETVTNDGDGNMTAGPLPSGTMGSYTYDSRNRLSSAGGLTYTYDAEGHRIGIGGTETQSFLVDSVSDLPQVIQRTKNGVTTRYVYGAGLLYELDASNQPTYYHFDQTGNTAALTDSTGAVVDRIAYSPYGTIRFRQTNFDTPFLFNGNYGVMSDSNGLISMRARYYNPLICRFINSDPARSGWNWYAYANGDPIDFIDPTGEWAGVDDAVFAGGGALVGVAGKFVANIVTHTEHHWQDYVAAAVGGAAGGETLLYTANPIAAGAAGGFTSNLASQGLNIATNRQQSFSVKSTVVETSIGAATGLIPGLRIPGISAGSKSYVQIYGQMATKFENGTISNVSTQTAVKMVIGIGVKTAAVEGAVYGSAASNIVSKLSNK